MNALDQNTLTAMQEQRDYLITHSRAAKSAMDTIVCELQSSVTCMAWSQKKFDRKIDSLKWWSGVYADHLQSIHWLTDKIVKLGGIA